LGRFDLVTYNKVLEHVKDPVKLLQKAQDHLLPGGFIYVEVPDGEAAMIDGKDREEFLLGHIHVFSAASLALMATRAGLSICRLERLREPSKKYTLWATMIPKTEANSSHE
jgi:2-polyprenyl-3-methyl-5-hydroxy-6-metoxy-1,4-benzoquinol methylase